MVNNKILVVEDDEHIIELLKFNLEKNNYQVIIAKDGEEGIEKVKEIEPDLVLLDLMLPKIDGTKVCMKIKNDEKFVDIPIIMLTAKSDEMDKVLGLEIGADDYVTKPFSVRELLARIKVVLNRYNKNKSSNKKNESSKITIDKMEIDLDKHEVRINNKLVKLTYKEFELLKLLSENRGNVLSRDLLLDKIWGYDYYGRTRTVDVHIRHIRSKISKLIEDDFKNIETIRGVGYKMK